MARRLNPGYRSRCAHTSPRSPPLPRLHRAWLQLLPGQDKPKDKTGFGPRSVPCPGTSPSTRQAPQASSRNPAHCALRCRDHIPVGFSLASGLAVAPIPEALETSILPPSDVPCSPHSYPRLPLRSVHTNALQSSLKKKVHRTIRRKPPCEAVTQP